MLNDHAFKYLMSNEKLAKKVLSTILEQEVIELELNQQEIVVPAQAAKFTLFRLDFKAVIEDENGKREKVMIELQKSKLPTNLLRFRNYIGYSYTQSSTKISEDKTEEELLYPIIAIYILGYKLVDIEVMAALVDRKIINASTKEELQIESDFIELLTHKCYILQAGRLPKKRRTRLEKFMTLFNQAWIGEKRYILDLEEIPEEFKDIAKYLQNPLMNQAIIKQLEAEAEAEIMMAVQEAKLAKLKEEERRLKEDAQQKEAEERQLKENALLKLARLLKKHNTPISEIMTQTGLSKKVIEALE